MNNPIIFTDEPIRKAIEAVLSLLDITDIPQKIGITVANANNVDYRNNLIRLLHAHCNTIIVIRFGRNDECNKTDWNDLDGKVVKKVSGVVELINALSSQLNSSDWQPARLLKRLQAKAVYQDLLYIFGHSSRTDITNRLFAPIRMLLKHEDAASAKKIWLNSISEKKNEGVIVLFQRDVITPINNNPKSSLLYGDFGSMLRDHTNDLVKLFGRKEDLNPNEIPIAIDRLENLMSLLTECRMQAGITINPKTKRENQKNQEYELVSFASDETRRRILIIDDDAESWRPVLEIVKNVLDIDIYVSTDTKHYWRLNGAATNTKHVSYVDRGLPDFDLLLLDIYLGEEYGLDILNHIRSRIMHLPVILWTTSTDKELPSQAALANGFIFKKTATIDGIASIINTWLSVGNSQRLWCLPNPFFDYALRDPALREVALAFTKWTLRYMDCFHAVDHFYFKYFNDHGGRHILGVLDAAAKLLRPFLYKDFLLNKEVYNQDGTHDLKKENEIRNKRIFCLYISILCHEFGMFPIYEGEKPPKLSNKQPSKAYWQQMESMRKLHSIRGMLMFRSSVDKSSSEFNVEGLGYYLSYLNEIHEEKVVDNDSFAVIALLIGYHQRCLDLSETEIESYTTAACFEAKNGGSDDKCAKSKINAASTPGTAGKNWTNWEAVKKSTTSTWKAVLNSSNSIWDINSVRGLCAILRFADALDVDHTRVPADFILNDKNRRAVQDVEDCKRQVLASVQIDQGIVSLAFYASEPDSLHKWFKTCFNFAKKGFNCINQKMSILDDDEKEKKDFATLLNDDNKKDEDRPVFEELLADSDKYTLQQCLANLLINPWQPDIDLGYIEKCLKGILQVYFTCLKYKGLCAMNKDVQSGMATAAALLVILEIRDEYKAIKAVNLQDVIKLDNDLDWRGEPLPSILRGRKDKKKLDILCF
jgi:CheY-like chemotaxis protein